MHRLELSFEGQTHRTSSGSAHKGEEEGSVRIPGFPTGEIGGIVACFPKWGECKPRKKGTGLREIKRAEFLKVDSMSYYTYPALSPVLAHRSSLPDQWGCSFGPC